MSNTTSFLNSSLYIIAEGGVNHNGDIALAMKIIEEAKAIGADAIKFQTWITDRVYSRRDSIKPEYQKQGTDASESEYDTIKKLELPFSQFITLKEHAEKVGIDLLSTPDEQESAEFLINELHLPLLKVASQDIDNLPFLDFLGRKGVPVILSTGTATLAEVSKAVETIQTAGCQDLAILHCTSCYPALQESVNLRAMVTLRDAFHLPVGYSDHTVGLEVACAAVALGACILEKHFTISRTLPGPDQQASLEPHEFKAYIDKARMIQKALGDGIKRPSLEELPNRIAMRRYLVAAKDLPAGHLINPEDVILKKVSYGLGSTYFDLVVGSRTRCAIKMDDRISLDMLAFEPTAGIEVQGARSASCGRG